MIRQKYKYAYDEQNNFICIDDVNVVERINHKYKCASCGKELIPKLGNIRIHHFAHKENVTCNGESYLHLLSKHILKKRFDNSDTFIFKYWCNFECDLVEHCPSLKHRGYSVCQDLRLITIDLKTLYDKCELEKKDKDSGKIPDLVLYDSKGINPPMWLEIYVTNKCSAEKKYSGKQIIEFHITSEEQAISLSSIDLVKAKHQECFDSEEIKPTIEINTYNFIDFSKGQVENEYIKKYLASLTQNGEINVRRISCRENIIDPSPEEFAVIQFYFYNAEIDPIIVAKTLFSKYGFGNYRNCLLCKKYNKSYCEFFHRNTPPDINAIYCGNYIHIEQDFDDWCLANKKITDSNIRKNVNEKLTITINRYEESDLLDFSSHKPSMAKEEEKECRQFATFIYDRISKFNSFMEWNVSAPEPYFNNTEPCLIFSVDCKDYKQQIIIERWTIDNSLLQIYAKEEGSYQIEEPVTINEIEKVLNTFFDTYKNKNTLSFEDIDFDYVEDQDDDDEWLLNYI